MVSSEGPVYRFNESACNGFQPTIENCLGYLFIPPLLSHIPLTGFAIMLIIGISSIELDLTIIITFSIASRIGVSQGVVKYIAIMIELLWIIEIGSYGIWAQEAT
jgi:hypothetical protein